MLVTRRYRRALRPQQRLEIARTSLSRISRSRGDEWSSALLARRFRRVSRRHDHKTKRSVVACSLCRVAQGLVRGPDLARLLAYIRLVDTRILDDLAGLDRKCRRNVLVGCSGLEA